MRRPLALASLAAALAALLAPVDAEAIPAFARRYRFSCTTCHAPFPRLKPFGGEFAGRGFALEEGQEPARSDIDVGDELLDLPREFPIALRFDAFAAAREGEPGFDLETPWIFKVLAGGKIADGVGFYAYYILEQGEPGKIEDAFVQLARPFGLPFDLAVGQFQVSDPVAKRELRLTRADYEILKVTPFDSAIDLTYDRGVVLSSGLGPIEAVLTVTNGTGIGEASEGFDGDRYKNFGLHLSAEVGPLAVGAYGFVGTEVDDLGERNRAWIFGPQLALSLGERLALVAVYLERRDEDPTFGATGLEDVETRGGFVEATLHPGGPDGRATVTALYDRVESDDPGSERDAAALSLSWLLRRNVRLVAEGGWDLDREEWTASVGTIAAF